MEPAVGQVGDEQHSAVFIYLDVTQPSLPNPWDGSLVGKLTRIGGWATVAVGAGIQCVPQCRRP